MPTISKVQLEVTPNADGSNTVKLRYEVRFDDYELLAKSVFIEQIGLVAYYTFPLPTQNQEFELPIGRSLGFLKHHRPVVAEQRTQSESVEVLAGIFLPERVGATVCLDPHIPARACATSNTVDVPRDEQTLPELLEVPDFEIEIPPRVPGDPPGPGPGWYYYAGPTEAREVRGQSLPMGRTRYRGR